MGIPGIAQGVRNLPATEAMTVKKSLGLALATGVLMALVTPGAASAAQPPWGDKGASGPPVGACPNAKWRLVQPSGPEHLSAAYDFNGDGWVCVTFAPFSNPESLIVFMDNVVR